MASLQSVAVEEAGREPRKRASNVDLIDWRIVQRCVNAGLPSKDFWPIWKSFKPTLKNYGVYVTCIEQPNGTKDWIVQREENTKPDVTDLRELMQDEEIAGRTTAEWAAEATRQWSYDALATLDDYFAPPIPKNQELRQYQVQGVAAMIRRLIPPPESTGISGPETSHAVYLGDEMGLGKTVQAIALLNWLIEAHPETTFPILILCPKSIRFVWRHEWQRWSTSKMFLTEISNQRAAYKVEMIRNRKVIVTNYDKLSVKGRTRDALIDRPWGTLICDESQRVKNPAAGRTQAVQDMRANFRVFLSGTPMPNRPIELKTQLDILTPNYWDTDAAFDRRYQPGDEEMLKELRDRMKATVMIRRLKTDHGIADELPDKQRQLILTEVTTGAIEAMERAEEKLREQGWSTASVAKYFDEKLSGDHLLRAQVDDLARPVFFGEALSTLRRELGEAKVAGAIETIKEFLDDTGQKLVVFAHHRKVIEDLTDGLVEDYGAKKLYGGMKDDEREEAVRAFQEDDDCRVFVGGILAAGEGITLTAANNVLFIETDWTPANMLQAEDRVHRIGQKNNVNVRWYVMDETLDATIAQILMNKIDTIKITLGMSEYE